MTIGPLVAEPMGSKSFTGWYGRFWYIAWLVAWLTWIISSV